jgi:hypothetical protein
VRHGDGHGHHTLRLGLGLGQGLGLGLGLGLGSGLGLGLGLGLGGRGRTAARDLLLPLLLRDEARVRQRRLLRRRVVAERVLAPDRLERLLGRLATPAHAWHAEGKRVERMGEGRGRSCALEIWGARGASAESIFRWESPSRP